MDFAQDLFKEVKNFLVSGLSQSTVAACITWSLTPGSLLVLPCAKQGHHLSEATDSKKSEIPWGQIDCSQMRIVSMPELNEGKRPRILGNGLHGRVFRHAYDASNVGGDAAQNMQAEMDKVILDSGAGEHLNDVLAVGAEAVPEMKANVDKVILDSGADEHLNDVLAVGAEAAPEMQSNVDKAILKDDVDVGAEAATEMKAKLKAVIIDSGADEYLNDVGDEEFEFTEAENELLFNIAVSSSDADLQRELQELRSEMNAPENDTYDFFSDTESVGNQSNFSDFGEEILAEIQG